jgi:gluconate 2-dehydrogenase gamma chain
MDRSSGRRRFLKSAAAMGAALPAGVAAQTHKHDEQHAKHHEEQRGAQVPAYMFFTGPEVAFVQAAVARLIPADELGPGAKEAGVALFIDRQLFGGWGTMARMYRQGPHPEGTPQQGYQSPLTPQEVYRAAIRDVDAHCAKEFGKAFEQLTVAQQDEVLRGLDTGKIELGTVRAQFFFNMLLNSTIEGFFSDPIYGGNRDKVGWKLVGFPGVAAVYTPHIGRTTAYEAQPISIQDIVDNVAEVDEHGHAKHVMYPSPSQGEGQGGG